MGVNCLDTNLHGNDYGAGVLLRQCNACNAPVQILAKKECQMKIKA